MRFIIQTWKWRPDAATPARRGEPLPREEAQQRKREREAQRREDLGTRLLNPPRDAQFTAVSRQLAEDIKTVVDLIDTARAVLIGGWLTILITSPIPETFVTQGYDPTDLVNAIQGLSVIEREKIKQIITLEVIKVPPTLSREELKYWDALRRALNDPR